MKLDRHVHHRLRLQDALFVILLLVLAGLLAWLTQTWRHTSDWTAAARHTLDHESRQVVDLLDAPVDITAWVGPDRATRAGIEDLIERYRRAGADIRLEFHNPETSPGLARELGIRAGGELIVHHGGREQRLQNVNEGALTNALVRLTQTGERWIVFLEGHGERSPHGNANHDLGFLGERLRERGANVQTLDLSILPDIPGNTDVLVIAGPRDAYPDGHIDRITQYIERGGNLLWLTDTQPDAPLPEALAEWMGIERLPGIVTDPGAERYGLDNRGFLVIEAFADHPVSDGLGSVVLFPEAAALRARDRHGWRYEALVQSGERTWTAADGRTTEDFEAGAGDVIGPHVVAWAGERNGQRAAVIGDGDFLANAWIDNAANMEFGTRLFHWLSADDERIHIAPRRAPDLQIGLSATSAAMIGLGFLLVLPATMLAVGATIWWRRYRN